MVFASGTVKTTNGSPTGGLPYSGGDVFSSEEIVIAPEPERELTFEVTISAAEGEIVQLPTGLPAADGDVVTLTVDELEELGRGILGDIIDLDSVNSLVLNVGSTPWTIEEDRVGEFTEEEITIDSEVAE